MIYILNNVIKYNSDLGEIFRLDTEISVMKFTPVLNYIFIILIENNKKTISREEILKKISDKYDLKVSINTLNQYVSTLRKLLHQQLLVENAILSISKKGLVFSSEIHIEESITKFNNKEKIKTIGEEIKKTTEENRIRLTAQEKPLKSLIAFNHKKDSIRKILLIICISLFLVIVYLAIQIKSIKFPYTLIPSYKISIIGDCPVYGFKENTQEYISKTINKQVVDFNLTCKKGDVFYYYDNAQKIANNKHSLLVKCNENKHCISTRINWQGQHD